MLSPTYTKDVYRGSMYSLHVVSWNPLAQMSMLVIAAGHLQPRALS